jgi:hypothetical protein
MHVTVAICTWNRAGLLAQTLEQMRQLVIPPGVTWELIVVNNNCTDDTDQVIARCCWPRRSSRCGSLDYAAVCAEAGHHAERG